MSYRILTKNSVDNTNIDGARQNHFNAGMRSGIVKGALNECNITSPASNQIVINTGELRISGHQIVIEESEQLQLTNTPQTATDYSIIAEISVNDSSVPTFRIFIQPQNSGLVQDNLFTSLNGIGTYQIKLANFTQNTDGSILNLERVADLISGITKEQIDSKLSLSGGTMAGDIQLPAGKFLVDNKGYGLVGYYGTGSATYGNPNRGINLRGNTTRPQYNSADIALLSDMADRIIETYISSDNKTWYRKWASGWKECGINRVGENQSWQKFILTLPITFASVNRMNVTTGICGNNSESTNAITAQSGGFFNWTTTSITVYADNTWIKNIYVCGF